MMFQMIQPKRLLPKPLSVSHLHQYSAFKELLGGYRKRLLFYLCFCGFPSWQQLLWRKPDPRLRNLGRSWSPVQILMDFISLCFGLGSDSFLRTQARWRPSYRLTTMLSLIGQCPWWPFVRNTFRERELIFSYMKLHFMQTIKPFK